MLTELNPAHLPDNWEVKEQTPDESVYQATGLVDTSYATDHGKRNVTVEKWHKHEWFVFVWDPETGGDIHEIPTSFAHRSAAETAALGLMTKRVESTGENPHDGTEESAQEATA